jgi:hypothetical protein
LADVSKTAARFNFFASFTASSKLTFLFPSKSLLFPTSIIFFDASYALEVIKLLIYSSIESNDALLEMS